MLVCGFSGRAFETLTRFDAVLPCRLFYWAIPDLANRWREWPGIGGLPVAGSERAGKCEATSKLPLRWAPAINRAAAASRNARHRPAPSRKSFRQ